MRHRSMSAAAAACVMLTAIFCTPAWAQETDPLILDALNFISSDVIDADAKILTGQAPSFSGTIVSRDVRHPDHQKAEEFLLDRLQESDADAAAVEFDCGLDHACANLVAEIPGTVPSDRSWIISAHYDSTNGDDPSLPAPGAVDNASGVVIVLQALSALHRYEFSDTIRFILFDAEEIGLLGSEAYAAQASVDGDAIQAVLNVDVPGWRVQGINLAFASSNGPSWPALQIFDGISRLYPCGTQVLGVPAAIIDTADMASFWPYGYSAYLVGSLYALTGFMNTGNDTYEKIDIEQCANLSRVATAYLAQQAGILGTVDDDTSDDVIDDDAQTDDNSFPDSDMEDTTPSGENTGHKGCGC